MKRFYQYVLISLPLFACGGSGSSDKPRNVAPDYSKLSQAQVKPTPLREASTQELGQMIKNGVRISLRDYTDQSLVFRNDALVAPTTDSQAEGGNFSGTNVQVDGVDEADFVKYDGNYIYLATPVDYSGEVPQASFKIFSTDPATASVSQVSDTPIDASYWGDISELYLVGNEAGTTSLASIRRSWSVIHLIEPMDADRAAMSTVLPYHMDTGINISLYDVQNPASPTKTWSLAIDGDLLGSRKIGNILYIVSSFVPRIDNLNYGATTTDEKVANEKQIANYQIEKLLPEYSINDGEPQPLNSSNTCLVSNNADNSLGYQNLVNITAVDLSSQELVESVCINSNIQGIYASLNNLYLGASDENWENWDEFTVVHKFSLTEEGIDYRATGSVEGYLGWSAPSFRMDEHNDYLRMVTTRYDDEGEPIHQLHILQETDGSQLESVAQLPNETHPKPIGKPLEDIYAVRFYGDKAYVVTFQRIDPLYVLDLANPEAPQIAGELELPGFSTYLHPVGDDYLFSFGYETDSNGMQTGIKAGLFDIRDIHNPILVNEHLIGGDYSYSQALHDHRALSFLQASDDQLRITLPTTDYFNTPEDEEHLWSDITQFGLHLFEINGLTSDDVSLDHLGEMTAGTVNGFGYSNDRGILHDNSVFFVHSPEVFGTLWPQE